MNIQLSDHFTYKKLFRFTAPSIVMMIFTSIYGVVDGFFVSNFVGKTPFAAVNFIMPFLMILGSVGFMFGTGGSALISMTIGQGHLERARKFFSLFIYISIALGIVIAILGILFLRPIASALGAEGSMLYNVQLIKYAGEDGVAAYGVLMYVNMIFLAAFIGYSVGTAPVIGYHYGAGNHRELRNLLMKSLAIIGGFSIAMLLAGELLAKPLSMMFVSYDPDLLELTLRGFVIFSFSFLFAGISIYGSSFFTALNNGLVSAIISFLRTLVFQIAAVLIFPSSGESTESGHPLWPQSLWRLL